MKKKKKSIQTWCYKFPKFKYNDKEKKLIRDGERDLNELIQSSKDCALDVIYNKFIGSGQGAIFPNKFEVKQSAYFDASNLESDDLLELGKLNSKADYYKEKFNLDSKLTVEEVFNKVTEIRLTNELKLKEALEVSKKLNDNKENIGDINEKKNE